ncbi:MAG: hypothetical protein RLY96_1056 [Actinomycetota bacterium]
MDFALLRDAFWGLTFDGIALGAIYALISLGYTLVYGVQVSWVSILMMIPVPVLQ